MSKDRNMKDPGQFEKADDRRAQQLLNDLRSLPRINAPADFESNLYRKIAEEKIKAPAWYDHFFSLFESGKSRVPMIAYGSLATIVVCVIGYYVLVTSNILNKKSEVIFEEQSAPIQLPVESKPELKQQTSQPDLNEKSEQDKNVLKESGQIQNQPTKTVTPAPPQAVPQATPKSEKPETQYRLEGAGTPPTPMKQMRTVKTVVPDSKDDKKESEKVSKEFNLQMRGVIAPEESIIGLIDSMVIKDSLRKADSLLRIQKHNSTIPKK